MKNKALEKAKHVVKEIKYLQMLLKMGVIAMDEYFTRRSWALEGAM